MRGLVTVVAFGLIFGLGGYWLVAKMSEDPGQLVGLAFGNATEESVDIELVVMITMVAFDGPKIKVFEGGAIEQWDEWIADHFELRPTGGEPLVLEKDKNARHIKRTRDDGMHEFYLRSTLEPGTEYVLEYQPRRSEPERYRYTFTAPSEDTDYTKPILKLIE